MKKVLSVAAAALFVVGLSAFADEKSECSKKKECSAKKECSKEA